MSSTVVDIHYLKEAGEIGQEGSAAPSRSQRAVRYALFALCSLIYLYPFMRVLMQGTDEGTLMYGAVRVMEGQVPFRDFFEVMGPGTFYWLALFFKVFGTTWLASRICLAVTSLATALVMYYLARQIGSKHQVLPTVLLLATSFGPLWPTISHHNDSNLFGLLSFSALLLFLKHRHPVLIFTAGTLAGLTTCFLQPKGIFLLVSFLLSIWVMQRKSATFLKAASWLVAGYTLVVFTVIALFWQAGALADWIYANLVWPLTRYSAGNAVRYAVGLREFYWHKWAAALSASFTPTVGCSVATILAVPLLFVALLPLILGVVALLCRSTAFTSVTVPYWAAGCALWLSEIHRKDITHLAFGSPILVILCFYLCERIEKKTIIYAMQVLTICTVFLASVNAFITLSATTKTLTRRGVVYTFKRDPVTEFLVAHVKPGEPIFAYPYSPMSYFLAGAKNPTRLSILVYRMHTDAQIQQVIQALDTYKVQYVVWNASATFDDAGIKWAFPENWAPRKEELIVEPYLLTHYDVVWADKGNRILKRKDTRQAATPISWRDQDPPLHTTSVRLTSLSDTRDQQIRK